MTTFRRDRDDMGVIITMSKKDRFTGWLLIFLFCLAGICYVTYSTISNIYSPSDWTILIPMAIILSMIEITIFEEYSSRRKTPKLIEGMSLILIILPIFLYLYYAVFAFIESA